MGSPCPLSPSDRSSLRALAGKVVASVEDDAEMPLDDVRWMELHGQRYYYKDDVESLVMRLCQALIAEMDDLAAMTKARDEACDGWQRSLDQSDYPDGSFAKVDRAEIQRLRTIGSPK